jgi:hypothetical protein
LNYIPLELAQDYRYYTNNVNSWYLSNKK